MKNLMIAIIGIGISFSNNSYSQTDSFLKDYKAPSYTQNLLTLGFNGSSAGGSSLTSSAHWLKSAFRVLYDRRSNQERYQGVFRAQLDNVFNVHNINTNVNLNLASGILVQTNSNFYVRDQWFLGVGGFSSLGITKTREDFNNEDTVRFNFGINPTFSIGYGRVEPISYARYAMDIDRMLSQADVTNDMSHEELTDLADKLTLLMNRRYYDGRLARIYQLEAVDSTLEESGLDFDRNMRYFSRLQDAFYYSRHQIRNSGIRHELGLATNADFDFNEFDTNEEFNYMFYRFSAFIPQSYSIQHNANVSISSNLGASYLTGNYELGIYPTTRTALTFSGGLSASLSNGEMGFLGRLNSSITYYISPRLRLSGTFGYNNYDYYVGNGLDAPNNINAVKRITYRASLKLNYAIF